MTPHAPQCLILCPKCEQARTMPVAAWADGRVAQGICRECARAIVSGLSGAMVDIEPKIT